MGAVLHHGHSHSHGGHGYSHRSERRSKTKSPYKSPTRLVIVEQDDHENVNVRAAFIHVLGDLLQSIGVFIAALLIWFKVRVLNLIIIIIIIIIIMMMIIIMFL